MEVKFILSPSGRFGLGYHIGEVATIEKELATELIELGYAELTKQGKEEVEIEKAVKEVKTEKKVKK